MPLWEKVLGDLAHCDDRPRRLILEDDDEFSGFYSGYLNLLFDPSQGPSMMIDPLELAKFSGPGQEVLHPFTLPESRPVVSLGGADLQVIVKIASIELTPEKPSYEGSWHIEGVPAERIISTGIYYFEQENIKDNFLNFREAIDDPAHADFNTQSPMGFCNSVEMHWKLGGVQTKEGRLIAFPNTMQRSEERRVGKEC